MFPDKKIAVYTCVTNGYDNLSPLLHSLSYADYFCFNDGSINVSSGWTDVQIESDKSGNEAARYYKITPHLNSLLKNYELLIWIDGNIEIVGDLNALIENVCSSDGDIFMYDHPIRACVYDEIDTCFLHIKMSLMNAKMSKRLLEECGIKKNAGLFETGVMLRKNNDATKKLMNCWWENFKEESSGRDQISLIRAIKESNVEVVSLGFPDYRFDHKFFLYKGGHRDRGFVEKVLWQCRRSIILVLMKFGMIKF